MSLVESRLATFNFIIWWAEARIKFRLRLHLAENDGISINVLSLAQIKNSSVANVAGVNINDPQFIAYVNEAVRQLVNLGEWWGTVKAMVGTSYRGCMVWPAGVDSVLATNINCRPATVANYWYEFFPLETVLDGTFAGYGYGGGFSDFVSQFPMSQRAPKSVVRFSGTTPVFNQPSTSDPFAVQVTADNAVDYGKTVTIYGKDTNGLEIVTLRPDGSTQRGYVLTLSSLSPYTTVTFSEISAVIKDTTVANVRLWVYAPAAPFGTPVAVYSGSETNPQYLFSELTRTLGFVNSANPCLQRVEALVKLSPMPVAQDSDLVIIDNIDAIKSMVQSIRAREAGNDDDSNKFELNAVRRLNAELRSRFPNQQVVARCNPVGNMIASPI